MSGVDVCRVLSLSSCVSVADILGPKLVHSGHSVREVLTTGVSVLFGEEGKIERENADFTVWLG